MSSEQRDLGYRIEDCDTCGDDVVEIVAEGREEEELCERHLEELKEKTRDVRGRERDA